MSDQEAAPDNAEKNKGFWNKAEQISRVYHNIMDGSFKLLIMTGIVAALVFGAGVYSKTTSGIDSAGSWMCEYLNPFCDTPREAEAKAEKARDEAKQVAIAEAEKARKDDEQRKTESAVSNEGAEEQGMFSRFWAMVKGWFSGNEAQES